MHTKRYVKVYSVGLWLCSMAISQASSLDMDSYFKAYRETSYEVKNPLVLIAGATTYLHMENLEAAGCDMNRLYTLFGDFYGYDVQSTLTLELKKKEHVLTQHQFKAFLLSKRKQLYYNEYDYDGLIFVWCGYGQKDMLYFSDTLFDDQKTYMSLSRLKYYFSSTELPGFALYAKIFIHAVYPPKPSVLPLCSSLQIKPSLSTPYALRNMLSLYGKKLSLGTTCKKSHTYGYLAQSLDIALRKCEKSNRTFRKKLRWVDFLMMKLSHQCEGLVSEDEGVLGDIYLITPREQEKNWAKQVIRLHKQLASEENIEATKSELYALRKQQLIYLAVRSKINTSAIMDCYHSIIYPYLSKELKDEEGKRYEKWLFHYGDSLCQAYEYGNYISMSHMLAKKGQNMEHLSCWNLGRFFHYAVEKGYIKMVRVLIDKHHVDINAKKKGFHALHLAAKYGKCNMIKLFINTYKVDINTKAEKNWLVLHIAACYGQCNVIKLLINTYHVDIHAITEEGFHALYIAAYHGRCHVMKLLLGTYKVDVNVRNPYNNDHCLHAVACSGQHDAITLLLDTYHVDINIRNKHGEHALHIVARYGHFYLVKLLLDIYKVDVNIRNKDDEHALHIAVYHGHCDVVTLLLDTYHVDINIRAKFNTHALHIAAFRGECDIIRLLVDIYHVNVHLKNGSGLHAIHYAAFGGSCEAIQLLVKKYKVDVHMRSKKHEHALHLATQKKQYKVMEELINVYKVDIHVVNNEGETSLHLAAKAKDQEAYELLVRLGANENKRIGKIGKTAKEFKTW